MNEKTRYKLHRILDLAMDASEQGDIAINICCCADGAASVFTTICDGEYKKDAQMETMSAYIDKEGKASIQDILITLHSRNYIIFFTVEIQTISTKNILSATLDLVANKYPFF